MHFQTPLATRKSLSCKCSCNWDFSVAGEVATEKSQLRPHLQLEKNLVATRIAMRFSIAVATAIFQLRPHLQPEKVSVASGVATGIFPLRVRL